jgi:hypothetical protein
MDGVRGAFSDVIYISGMLGIDGVDFPLPFVVKAGDGDLLHVAFVLDNESIGRFAGTPARLAQRRVA